MYQEVDVGKVRGQGPHAWHSATELPRAMLELTSLAYAWPWLAGTPRGDGHAVLILPGFTVGDESTFILRRYLQRLGYRPLRWEQGRNTGRLELQEQLVDYFYRLAREHGRLSIIGHSLGGVYARQLGRQFPDSVRQVITLGSPLAATGADSTHALVRRLFRFMSGVTRDEMRDHSESAAEHLPQVPSTAIYSKSDGVVHWSACLEYQSARAENIEVVGSHTGLAVNPLVLYALADRLAQADGDWRPFRRRGRWRALLFPEPEQLATRPGAREDGQAAACAS